ncbi:MAG: class I SAM-dependent methyltransferase [candidate division Zixibacteria bacterium]|nr:class I SAM-dependent methyltransferase [candidate division Zixibacteria bacterium]
MREFSSGELLDKYVSREKLDLYLNEVGKANAKFSLYSRNLTRKDLELLVADCLIPFELGWLSEENEKILDIGSGWGLPALIYLMANRELNITLAERSRKKADFLSLLLHRLELKATVHADDVRTLPQDMKFDLILSRRVAFEEKLIKQIKTLSHDKTIMIYFGTAFPGNSFGESKLVEYSIDSLESRTIVRANVF